jgi:hypothetical protein
MLKTNPKRNSDRRSGVAGVRYTSIVGPGGSPNHLAITPEDFRAFQEQPLLLGGTVTAAFCDLESKLLSRSVLSRPGYEIVTVAATRDAPVFAGDARAIPN